MFRIKTRAQESRRRLRRLLSEQLESRQLMASDFAAWTPASAPIFAVSAFGHAVNVGESNWGESAEAGFAVGSVDGHELPSDLSSFPAIFGSTELTEFEAAEPILVEESGFAVALPFPPGLVGKSGAVSMGGVSTFARAMPTANGTNVDELPEDVPDLPLEASFVVGMDGSKFIASELGESHFVDAFDLAAAW